MQRLGVDIALVANNAVPLSDRLKEMSKIAKDNVAIMQVFGKENAGVATGLLNNVNDFGKYIDAVNSTGIAAKMAATNNDTLSVAIDQLSGKWVTMLTGSSTVNAGLTLVKNTVQFVTDHLEGLVTIGGSVIAFFAVWKGYIWSTQALAFTLSKAIAAVNFAEGIGTVVNGKYAVSCFATTAGMNGMAFASFFLETSLVTLTVATGGIILALGLIAFALTDDYDAARKLNGSLDETKNGFKQIHKPITDAEIALSKYNKAMDTYNEVQDFKAHRDYEYKRGMVYGLAFTALNAVTHPVLSHGSNMVGYAPPSKADYPALDSTAATNPMVEQVNNRAEQRAAKGGATQQQIELTIHNNSGHDISTDSTGAPAVNVSSTTNAWANK